MVSEGVLNWMLFPKNYFTLDGRECDKIGVSFYAFRTHGGNDRCKMELGEDGFYYPFMNDSLSHKEKVLVRDTCPAIHIEATPHKGTWGAMKYICQAWSGDDGIRHKAASGGVVTSLAIFLLESNKVDGILQVGVRDDNYLYNELKVSRTREEVIKNAQSRYAPALVFHRIKEILDTDDACYGFIGKPCDMAAMQNFIREFQQYEGRIKFYISIFCAGMPSYNATIQTWQQSGHKDEPIKLKYRGDGWPGNFQADFKDGSTYHISYNESWGEILGKQLGFRCKICPDGIGMLADVSVGDSWNTKNGYPDFTEDDGKCFCMVRSEKGDELLESAAQQGYIEKQSIELNKIQEQQPYQWERRKLVGWRILAVQLYTRGLLSFTGLSIFRQAIKANLWKGIRNSLGTYKRIININGK